MQAALAAEALMKMFTDAATETLNSQGHHQLTQHAGHAAGVQLVRVIAAHQQKTAGHAKNRKTAGMQDAHGTRAAPPVLTAVCAAA